MTIFDGIKTAEKLQVLQTKTIGLKECRERFEHLSKNEEDIDSNEVDKILRNLNEDKICIENPKNNGGLCIGDMGSPLVSNNKLVGVATWAFGCSVGMPDVYTNVYRNVNWIKSEMNSILKY